MEATARALLRERGHDEAGRLQVEVRVRGRVRALLRAAARVRATSDLVGVEDVLARRRLARELADEGLPVPDIADALGVSRGRALVLAAGGHLPSPRDPGSGARADPPASHSAHPAR